ncbi:hypothetical protein PC115_g10836 [Phytophthora cactorum]|uniref:Uncharacterized protein n=1 Tax=Phytophthora cactorum TaxID=29920 RepID=A0A8T1CAJ7_9STRA|nr:hypothetical protein PC115_g10836 [Phytophthora cactorum]
MADGNKRRRELAAFGEIWGHQNGSEADGTMVEPPATSSPDPVLPEGIEKVTGLVANTDMDGSGDGG